MIRDLVNFGLGSAYVAKERLEEELKLLSEKGKISSQEVKDVIEKAKIKGQEEEDKFKETLKTQLKEAVDELGLATKEDIEKLKKDLSGK